MKRFIIILPLFLLLPGCDSSGGMDNVVEDCPIKAEELTFGSLDTYTTLNVDIVVDTTETIQFPELRGEEQQNIEFTLAGEEGRVVFRGDLCCARFFEVPYDPGETINYFEIFPHLDFPRGGKESDIYKTKQIEITNEVECEVL